MNRPTTLDLRLPLDSARLAGARRQLKAFLAAAGVPSGQAGNLVLSAQEALKNAIRFSRSEAGVDLHVTAGADAVVLVVRDHGVGIHGVPRDPAELRDNPPDPLADSGRGLFLMASLVDDLELRSNHGLEVTMTCHLRRQPLRAAQ